MKFEIQGLDEVREAFRNLTPDQRDRLSRGMREVAGMTRLGLEPGQAADILGAEAEAYLRGEPNP